MMAQRTSKKYMNMAHSEKNESVMMNDNGDNDVMYVLTSVCFESPSSVCAPKSSSANENRSMRCVKFMADDRIIRWETTQLLRHTVDRDHAYHVCVSTLVMHRLAGRDVKITSQLRKRINGGPQMN